MQPLEINFSVVMMLAKGINIGGQMLEATLEEHSHATITKIKLFWSQLRANDVLSCVPIFSYLEYKNYYYFEII